MDLYEQLLHNTSPGKFFTDDLVLDTPNVPVRVIAYYLPQFHAVAENDSWWGQGFTEWTNVTKAVPRFEGHYQPHLPSALGFYDLSHSGTLPRQADLAKRYGLHGFCFHYYWFSGRKVLEKPLELLLASPEIDLPFCVNWANENWTRRWDGKEREILLEQRYSPADDAALALDLARLAKDRRYITIGGRPLVMIYRPGQLPDARQTIQRWTEVFAAEGLPSPFVIMPQSDGDEDPRGYGMEAAAGFPPHTCADGGKAGQSAESKALLAGDRLFDKTFSGKVLEYRDVAAAALAKAPDGYRFFPGVMPSWDNDPRRPGRGTTIIGSTPVLYGQWLRGACRYALRAANPDERLVFLNAWNEWGEGAHMEPDRHYGFAYLAQTRRVLTGLDDGVTDEGFARRYQPHPAKKSKFGLNLGLRAKVAKTLEALADAIR